jgi:hypothetical protein
MLTRADRNGKSELKASKRLKIFVEFFPPHCGYFMLTRADLNSQPGLEALKH